jgi:hypothetical protein
MQIVAQSSGIESLVQKHPLAAMLVKQIHSSSMDDYTVRLEDGLYMVGAP